MGRRAAPVAVLGGSFDHLHAGHRALLAAGFAAAQRVGIGITTDAYLRHNRKPYAGRIQSYATRRRILVGYLARSYPRSRWWIVPLSDGWGRSVERGVDVLIASKETADGAAAVNRERRRRGLPAVPLLLVELVRGEDGLPVSSRRVRAGIIDPSGRRRTPLRVRILGVLPEERASVRSAVRAVFPRLEVRTQWRSPAASGPSAVGTTDRRRAAAAAEAASHGVDYGIVILRATGRGLSAGTSSWVAVSSSAGSITLRIGTRRRAGVPRAVTAALRARRRVGRARGGEP
ncbi:MAG: pantetheine-phosphate adenylyltransferase [Thermoplasmata archaeon]|nr:pantetheine-phosphate adenylyltransferase [Thermoplasmata archaeon]